MGSSEGREESADTGRSTFLVTLDGKAVAGLEKVNAPIGEPDTLTRVSKKRSGKVEVQEAMSGTLVISRADLPPMMQLSDDLAKRREDRVRRARERKEAERAPRLFDAY